MAKVRPKTPPKIRPRRGVTRQEDPFTGQVVAHSKAYWANRHAQYQQRYGPEDIAAPLGPSGVAKEVDAASRQKFGPQYQQLSDQRRVSQQQDVNLKDWYGAYQQQVAQAGQKSQDAYGQAKAFTDNAANSSSAIDASQRAALAGQQQADATARGGQVDPSQGLVGQQADQSRRSALQQFSSMLAGQGASQASYMADKSRIGAGAELSAHTAEANRRAGLGQLVRQTQGQEADYRTTLRGSLRQGERTNQQAVAALGIKQAGAQADAAAKAANLDLGQQRVGIERQRASFTAAQQREQARHNRTSEQVASPERAVRPAPPVGGGAETSG